MIRTLTNLTYMQIKLKSNIFYYSRFFFILFQILLPKNALIVNTSCPSIHFPEQATCLLVLIFFVLVCGWSLLLYYWLTAIYYESYKINQPLNCKIYRASSFLLPWLQIKLRSSPKRAAFHSHWIVIFSNSLSYARSIPSCSPAA